MDVAGVEPCGQTVEQGPHVTDAVTQERRRRHHHIGADQQIFDHLVGVLDAGGGGERRLHAPGKHREPQQRQADLGRGAELQIAVDSAASPRSMSGW